MAGPARRSHGADLMSRTETFIRAYHRNLLQERALAERVQRLERHHADRVGRISNAIYDVYLDEQLPRERDMVTRGLAPPPARQLVDTGRRDAALNAAVQVSVDTFLGRTDAVRKADGEGEARDGVITLEQSPVDDVSEEKKETEDDEGSCQTGQGSEGTSLGSRTESTPHWPKHKSYRPTAFRVQMPHTYRANLLQMKSRDYTRLKNNVSYDKLIVRLGGEHQQERLKAKARELMERQLASIPSRGQSQQSSRLYFGGEEDAYPAAGEGRVRSLSDLHGLKALSKRKGKQKMVRRHTGQTLVPFTSTPTQDTTNVSSNWSDGGSPLVSKSSYSNGAAYDVHKDVRMSAATKRVIRELRSVLLGARSDDVLPAIYEGADDRALRCSQWAARDYDRVQEEHSSSSDHLPDITTDQHHKSSDNTQFGKQSTSPKLIMESQNENVELCKDQQNTCQGGDLEYSDVFISEADFKYKRKTINDAAKPRASCSHKRTCHKKQTEQN